MINCRNELCTIYLCILLRREEDNKLLEAELENRPPGALGPYFREFYFMIRNKLL